jgi:tryptophanase
LITKNNQENYMQILHENKWNNNSYNTELLRLIIDCALYWKVHIDELTSKLKKACNAIRSVKLFMFLEVLKMIYFSYFHYYIIWHNSGGGILLIVKLYSKFK